MMRFRVVGAVGALVLMKGGPALALPHPLAVVFARPAADTLGAIAKGCAGDEEAVTARDGEAVTCELPLDRPERIAAWVVLREPFAPDPRAFVRFTVSPIGPAASTVQVSGWVQDSGALSVRRRASLAGPGFDARLRAFLTRLGGRPAPA